MEKSFNPLDRVSSTALSELAEMLSLPAYYGVARPASKWLGRQARKVKTVHADVRRPRNIFARLTIKLSEKFDVPHLPVPAVLCAAHKGLDPWVMQRLFVLVVREVTVRSDRIRRMAGADSEVDLFVTRLDALSALWTDGRLFRSSLPHAVEAARVFRYRPVDSGCEACLLAVVGARDQVLHDLRASLLSRKQSGRRSPELLRMVEPWIRAMGPDVARGVLAESLDLSIKLRELRQESKQGHHRPGTGSSRPGRSSRSGGRGKQAERSRRHNDDYGDDDDETAQDDRATEAESPGYHEAIHGCDDDEPDVDVSKWYAARSTVALDQNAAALHPSLRAPSIFSSPSAVPAPLRPSKAPPPRARLSRQPVPLPFVLGGTGADDRDYAGPMDDDAWTDCSLHTYAHLVPVVDDAIPVPPIPAHFLAPNASASAGRYAATSIYSQHNGGDVSPTQPPAWYGQPAPSMLSGYADQSGPALAALLAQLRNDDDRTTLDDKYEPAALSDSDHTIIDDGEQMALSDDDRDDNGTVVPDDSISVVGRRRARASRSRA